MDLITYFNQELFANQKDLDADKVIKELSGMKNSQPPEEPTFIINQTEVKDRLSLKLSDCIQERGFEHIVLTGRIGGGKTHFLNWIQSRLSQTGQFYMTKFQVQETSIVKYSFIQMIVSKLFQVYYEDFTQAIYSLVNNLQLDSSNRDKFIGDLGSLYRISNDLSTLLYTIQIRSDKASAAMRVIGASHGKTETSKLGIKKLRDADYLKIIEFFLSHKKREGFLLVLLDEFEHAYTYLTPANRRNFFISYKLFIDEAIKFNPPSLALITSVTEQYEGNLKEKVIKIEQALWSRLQHQVNSLREFEPSNIEEFKELLSELGLRYNIAYGYDGGFENDSEMRKRFLNRLGGESAQAMSYRDAILTLLRIMDDMRMNRESIKVSLPKNNNRYDKEISKAKNLWEKAHYNAKPALIKSSLELLFNDLNYKRINLVEELGSLLMISVDTQNKLFYIAISSNPKGLGERFKKCLEYKDKIEEVEGINFETIFIYEKQWETKTFLNMLKLHPDVKPISLEAEELYSILAYKNIDKDELTNKMRVDIERFVNDIV